MYRHPVTTPPAAVGEPRSPAPARSGAAPTGEAVQAQQQAARRWLLLAVMAMTVSALLAILLVLSRTPGVQELLGLKGAFHTVLVLHVDFSVLVWLLSFGGLLWSLATPHRAPLAFALTVGGALLMIASPWLGEAVPVMSNYIPVIDSPLFLAGLIGFAAGVSLLAWSGAMAPRAEPSLRLAALAWMATLTLFAWHAARLPQQGALAYEELFWGGGHLLQFVYLLLLLTVWQRLAQHPIVVPVKIMLLPVVAALAMGVAFAPGSAGSRAAFTHLMQFGTPLLLLPALWSLRTAGPRLRDEALAASLGLMGLGLLIGLLISNDTVTVTAHYHATNAAITVAFMGYAYRLLPPLGHAMPAPRAMRWQLRLYTTGMVLYVAGMASSGWLGVPRKSAMVIEHGGAQLAMGVMGVGGLLSVVATLLFVVLMGRGISRRAAPTLNNPAGELS